MENMAMKRLDYSAENCSVAATLSVVEENWTLIVLREAFFGLHRYEDFQAATGCARNAMRKATFPIIYA
jgi:DNA-binding HxlR family transcriptional regulator